MGARRRACRSLSRRGQDHHPKRGPTDTVDAVQQMVYGKTGVLPDQQRLIFADQELRDGRHLSRNNIQNESTGTLLQRRGGAPKTLYVAQPKYKNRSRRSSRGIWRPQARP